MTSFKKLIKQRNKAISDKISEIAYTPHVGVEQGSDEWFEERRGRFTGSQIKLLMKCGRATAKLAWGCPEKIIDIGEPALIYIYEKAMERETGFILKLNPSTAMQYGTKVEDAVVQKFLEGHDMYKFETVGFIPIKGLESILGASPDGLFSNKKERIGAEVKAPSSWRGYHERTEIEIDEKHIDFWQFQTEMMALEAESLISLIARPVQNTYEVAKGIDDPFITKVFTKITEASPIHQKAIRQRAVLGERIIETFLSKESIRFVDAVRIECSKFEI